MTRTCKQPGCDAALDPRNTSGLCRSHCLKAMHADPDFAAAHRERLKARNADPDIDMRQKHLRDMTPKQRADYDTLCKAGYTKAQALTALGLAE